MGQSVIRGLSVERPTRLGSTDPGLPPDGSGSGDAQRTSSLEQGD
jgi:hypothetical protein